MMGGGGYAFLKPTFPLRYYGFQKSQFCVTFCVTVGKFRFKING